MTSPDSESSTLENPLAEPRVAPPQPRPERPSKPAPQKSAKASQPPSSSSRWQMLKRKHAAEAASGGRTIPRRGFAVWRYRYVFFLHWVYVAVMRVKPERFPRPYIPNLSLSERDVNASTVVRNSTYKNAVSVAIISLAGGVGKTSTTVMLAKAMKEDRQEMAILAQDCNKDAGSLLDRLIRTVKFAVTDALNSIQYITTLPTFAHYCTNSDGVYFLASTAAGDYEGIGDITRPQWRGLIRKEKLFFNWIYNDLGNNSDSDSNLAALDESDGVILVMNQGNVGVEMAKKGFKFLLKKYPHLARNAVIVVNRHIVLPGRTDAHIAKIRQKFVEQFGEAVDNVTFMPVGLSVKLVFGVNIMFRSIRRRVRVQIREINAVLADKLASGRVDKQTLELTHAEMAEQGLITKVAPEDDIIFGDPTALENKQPASFSVNGSGQPARLSAATG